MRQDKTSYISTPDTDIESDVQIAPPNNVSSSNNNKSRSVPLYRNPKVLIASGVTLIGAAVGVTLGLTLPSSKSPNDAPIFPVNLSNGISPTLLSGYPVCTDFVEDLRQAAHYLVNVEIDRNARVSYRDEYYDYLPRGGRGFGGGDISIAMDEGVAEKGFSADSGGASDGGLGSSTAGEDSFGTNNQVDGVDEADIVKSDGTYVFAGYGNTLVIWDATSGTEYSRTVLPQEDDEGKSRCETMYSEDETDCYRGYSDLSITSLLLHEDRIVVIASSNDNLVGYEPILGGYRSTRVFIYDITSIPTDKSSLILVTRSDLQGVYKSARSIGSNAHIVTTSYVRTWNFLQEISPWGTNGETYRKLNEYEYRAKAYEVARESIDSFVTQLASEVLDSTDLPSSCRHITKLALMLKKAQTEDTDTNADSEDDNDQVLSFAPTGVFNTFTQVTSFNILGGDDTLFSTSGLFLPISSYTSNIYSSQEKLVISGEAYNQNADGQWKESTVFVALDLVDDTSTPHSIGEVPGSLLNQFSMDHWKDDAGVDYFRVATTSWATWGFDESTSRWTQIEESSSQVSVLQFPSSAVATSTTTGSEDDDTNDSIMEMVGNATDIGKTERIYAARFMGDTAYVVTFRQTDPFYTLDLTDPTNPHVVGELKIPGFSNYLHPILNGTHMLGVGQDANEEGRIQGLQISVFDVTDLSNPLQVQKYVESGGSGSSSEAQHEHKAFRYLEQSKKLILPASYFTAGFYSYENYFNGFIVYDIDVIEGITKSFQFSHMKENTYNLCWSNALLPARSLVFDGDLTTMKGHTVMSHDLETKVFRWEYNLDEDRLSSKEKPDSCYYWY